jgi:hypothetical protein
MSGFIIRTYPRLVLTISRLCYADSNISSQPLSATLCERIFETIECLEFDVAESLSTTIGAIYQTDTGALLKSSIINTAA